MEKANCKNCGELPIEMFYKHHTKGFQSLCKKCKTLYNKEHYKKDKDAYLSRAKKRNKKIGDEIRDKILSYLKGKKCELCPENDLVTFDFHHRDSKEKLFEIAKAASMQYNWDIIEKEILKCRILCSNCHRKLHAKENNNYKYRASIV